MNASTAIEWAVGLHHDPQSILARLEALTAQLRVYGRKFIESARSEKTVEPSSRVS